MAYCKHCGASIPDFAKFCPKCGTAMPVAASPEANVQSATEVQTTDPKAENQNFAPVADRADTVQTQPVQQSAPPQPDDRYVPTPSQYQQATPQQKTDYKGWFARNFVILYVLTGVVAYLLTELAAGYLAMSKGFSITLGVFAIIFALAFAAVAIINIVMWLSLNDTDLRTKSRTKNIVMLIVAIAIFVFVLLMCIIVFDTASKLY